MEVNNAERPRIGGNNVGKRDVALPGKVVTKFFRFGVPRDVPNVSAERRPFRQRRVQRRAPWAALNGGSADRRRGRCCSGRARQHRRALHLLSPASGGGARRAECGASVDATVASSGPVPRCVAVAATPDVATSDVASAGAHRLRAGAAEVGPGVGGTTAVGIVAAAIVVSTATSAAPPAAPIVSPRGVVAEALVALCALARDDGRIAPQGEPPRPSSLLPRLLPLRTR